MMRWGILGTGRIAATFADALAVSKGARLQAVASRTRSKAVAFASTHGAPDAHERYADLLANAAVDAVYVATPHPIHAEWAIRALRHGKHVLCEKPMGMNHAEVMAATYAARQHQRVLMEAFMYRCHPQTERIAALVADGSIGEVRHLTAQFGYHAAFDEHSRLFANALGGGGILDVGCYPVSMARLILGEPDSVQAHGHLGRSGVDEWSAAQLRYAGGTSAQVATSVGVLLDNTVTIYGSEGRIHVANPWLPGRDWSFELHRQGSVETISGEAEPLYVYEIEALQQAIADGAVEAAQMCHADSLGNARVLDAWRKEIGLTYASEKLPPARTSLKAADNRTAIARQPLAPLTKPVSRLVMGCDNQPNLSHASIMWDHFLDIGGNAFDTAHIYGEGRMERLLGTWQRQRGVREDIVIIGKGAHTPYNTPEHIGPQLTESLERLQTDYVDLYFLHRDNPDIPVDEFVSALNDELDAGRIRAFGGSNWTLERTRAFNLAASERELTGFAAISNNFSLARMVNQIWPGTESVDEAFLTYLADTQMALLPWSSQARGFFTPWASAVLAQRGGEQKAVTTMEPTVAELTRTWVDEANLARRARAEELAQARGTSMINIALAYVLHQPFPTFPLVGPRVLSEIDSCAEAMSCALTADDVAWLERG